MTDKAPERIWALPPVWKASPTTGTYLFEPVESDAFELVEYIRADIHESLQADNQAKDERIDRLQVDLETASVAKENSDKAFLYATERIEELEEDLHFVWRWIDRLAGGKPHDKPEERWEEYVGVLTAYPRSPHKTGDWFDG